MGQNRGKNAAYFIAGRVEPGEKVCYNSPKRPGAAPEDHTDDPDSLKSGFFMADFSAHLASLEDI